VLKLLKDNFVFYGLFIPVYVVSSFVISSAPLLIGGLGVIWFIVKKRYDLVVLAFLLTIILANNRSPIFHSYKDLRVVYAVILLALSSLVVFREKGIDSRVIYFLPFFIVGLLSSFLFSPTMISSVLEVISYFVVVTSIFVFVTYLLREYEFDLYEHILLIIGITLFISLIGKFLYPSVFLRSGRLQGFLGNPDFLSLFCVIAYVFTDHFKTKNSVLSEREIYFLKALIIICLFFTGSRTGYASLAIYIVITIFLFRGFSGRTIAIILGIGVIVAVLEIRLITNFLPFLKHLIRPQSLATASGRSIVWPVAIQEIYKQPWLGGGFSFYAYYMAHFAMSHGLKGVFWYGVWNSYLAMLLDTGLVGLLAYFFFIYGVVRKSSRFFIILPFLVAMTFTGMFEAWAESSLNPITPFFLLLFALISINGSRYENFSIA